MKLVCAALALTFLLNGCASNQNRSPNAAQDRTSVVAGLDCPSTGAELDVFKSEEHVISCLGRPQHVTSNPDGRHTGLYRFNEGIIIVFLYDADDNVIRHQAYKDEQ